MLLGDFALEKLDFFSDSFCQHGSYLLNLKSQGMNFSFIKTAYFTALKETFVSHDAVAMVKRMVLDQHV